MLQARKEALENSIRQRLVAIRERELEYYTNTARNIGNSVISARTHASCIPS